MNECFANNFSWEWFLVPRINMLAVFVIPLLVICFYQIIRKRIPKVPQRNGLVDTVLISLLIVLVFLLGSFEKGGPGNGLPFKSHLADNQNTEELPNEDPEIVPEKKVRFDRKNLDALAEKGFPSKDLPDILILKFDSEKKFFVSISLNTMENYLVEGKDTNEFWMNLRDTLGKIRTGDLPPKTGTSGSEKVSQNEEKKKVDCAGVLLVNPPSPSVRDYAPSVVQEIFPDIKMEIYNAAK